VSGGRKALLARRARLVEQAAEERDHLARLLGRWRKPLETADRTLSFLASLKRHAPLIGAGLGVGAAALAFARPRNIVGWVRDGIGAWQALTGWRRSAARLPEPGEPEAEGEVAPRLPEESGRRAPKAG
jgi:hypothetical protein